MLARKMLPLALMLALALALPLAQAQAQAQAQARVLRPPCQHYCKKPRDARGLAYCRKPLVRALPTGRPSRCQQSAQLYFDFNLGRFVNS